MATVGPPSTMVTRIFQLRREMPVAVAVAGGHGELMGGTVSVLASPPPRMGGAAAAGDR